MDSEKRPLFFLKWGLPIGIVLLAVALPFSGNKSSLWEMVKGFSRDNPAIVLQREAFVMFGLFGVALLHFLLKKFQEIYIMFGKRALWIYVIHLVLIYNYGIGLRAFIELKTLSINQAILAAVYIEVASLTLTFLVDYSLKKYKHSGKYYKIALAILLIYMLFF